MVSDSEKPLLLPLMIKNSFPWKMKKEKKLKFSAKMETPLIYGLSLTKMVY